MLALPPPAAHQGVLHCGMCSLAPGTHTAALATFCLQRGRAHQNRPWGPDARKPALFFSAPGAQPPRTSTQPQPDMQGTTGAGGLTQKQKLAAGAAALGLGYYLYSRRQAQQAASRGATPPSARWRRRQRSWRCCRKLPPPPVRGCLILNKRSQAKNVGDAVSRAGAATGRAVESAGQKACRGDVVWMHRACSEVHETGCWTCACKEQLCCLGSHPCAGGQRDAEGGGARPAGQAAVKRQ